MISFDCPKEDVEKVVEIAKATISACKAYGIEHDNRTTVMMDLMACNANGCPLDWDRLLKFDDANLLHDVLGIRKHINRTTGKLEGCFVPRCADQRVGV